MIRLVVALLLLALPVHALDGRRLSVRDGRLVDEHGREITLRGVNARATGIFDVTFSDGRQPLEDIPTFDAGDATKMRGFGFNLLRLPINWSALEAVRGQYDDAYLDRIAAIVKLCRARGILVLLDFHQDAFSKEIGQDGAPRWVLDVLLGPTGYPLLGGPLTDLSARRAAPYTRQAFVDFFTNKDGIQDDFAAAARALAKRFAGERGVLGYETMNEPLAVEAPDPQQALVDFHERVARAIRTVDRRHWVVFEPDTVRNIANQAPIPSSPFPDRRPMYAPHIYTGVFDLTNYNGNAAVLAPSMENAAAEAAAWGAPLLIGEYGIDPNNAHANDWINAELDLQDRLRAHSTFWLWEEVSSGHWGLFDNESSEPGGERVARTTALSRVYARAVPGHVLEHTFDATANTLRLRYTPRGRAKLELYVPARRYPQGFTLRCNGQVVRATAHPGTGVVRLACGTGSGIRTVELSPD